MVFMSPGFAGIKYQVSLGTWYYNVRQDCSLSMFAHMYAVHRTSVHALAGTQSTTLPTTSTIGTQVGQLLGIW